MAIVRGPASVVYGAQALGGVVNLILRDGRTSHGGTAEFRTGSWGLAEGRVGWGTTFSGGDVQGGDFYAGFSGGRRDSLRAGDGGPTLANTQWNRLGALAALGINTGLGRVGATVRTDGTYDTGFRGSSWNTTNREDRTNCRPTCSSTARRRTCASAGAASSTRSATWTTSSGARRSSARRPVCRCRGRTATPTAARSTSTVSASSPPRGCGRVLRCSSASRWSRARSTATGGGAACPAAASSRRCRRWTTTRRTATAGLYAELSQRLFADRLTLRGGARQSWGETRVEETPFLPLLRTRAADYESATWSGSWPLSISPAGLLGGPSRRAFAAGVQVGRSWRAGPHGQQRSTPLRPWPPLASRHRPHGPMAESVVWPSARR